MKAFHLALLKTVPGLLVAALALHPGEPAAASLGGNVPLTEPKKDAAGLIAAARAAVAAEPKSAPARIRLADLLLASGALEEAMRYYEEALALKPNAFDAKTGKGVVLAKMGKLKEAEQVLQGALVLNPNPVRVHYELGRLYQALGEHAKALQQFKEGIRKHESGR